MLPKGSGVNGFVNNSCADMHIVLLKKASKGDNEAFEQLMHVHLKLLYNYIRYTLAYKLFRGHKGYFARCNARHMERSWWL